MGVERFSSEALGEESNGWLNAGAEAGASLVGTTGAWA